jgi:hypothetical protein
VSHPTKTASLRGAALLAGGGVKEAKLAQKLEKKRRTSLTSEEDLAGRKTGEMGGPGRCHPVERRDLRRAQAQPSGRRRCLSKNRMENTAGRA